MRHALPLACLLLTALAAAPASQAQGSFGGHTFVIQSAQVEVSTLRPNLDMTAVMVQWEYDATVVGGNVLLQGQSATLEWDIDGANCSAPGVTVLGAREEVISFPIGWTGTTEGTSVFQAKLSSEAPGETSITCEFAGQVRPNGPLVPWSEPAHGAFALAASPPTPATASRTAPQAARCASPSECRTSPTPTAK